MPENTSQEISNQWRLGFFLQLSIFLWLLNFSSIALKNKLCEDVNRVHANILTIRSDCSLAYFIWFIYYDDDSLIALLVCKQMINGQ